ncbi:unnamed protein product [Prunus armeniaca]|uniref:Uncharacterized protein n=1 Tax=Prunus armeniaca TaxID=36596 RepID=A0A6J5VAK2_PRUAR|nr:unnamed protein product [Prunus armeniaca]
MDYNLAALKLLCVQLKDAQETSSENAMELHNIIFQRAWLQGILVHVSADGECLYLDDGTGVIELSLRPEFRGRPWNIGNHHPRRTLAFPRLLSLWPGRLTVPVCSSLALAMFEVQFQSSAMMFSQLYVPFPIGDPKKLCSS